MRGGRRLAPSPALAEVRAFHAAQVRAIPPGLRTLQPAIEPYTVEVSPGLRSLAAALDAAPH
jgi:nicotinate phosphoribosyltransferase